MKTNSTIKTKMILVAIIGFFIASNVSAQPWVIGTRVMTFTDASRGNRQIETEIFYPADVAGYQVALGSPADKRYPVVVFGHGTATGWNNYQYIWDQLVPKGFIVAIPKTEMAATPDVIEFAKDMAFVAESFEAMRWDNTSWLYKRHNSKSCMMGHDMGGSAAVHATQYYAGITALVTLGASTTSPSAQSIAANVTVPAVVMAGGEDCVAPAGAEQLPLFNALSSDCKTYVNLLDASHCNFAQGAGACTVNEVLCSGFPTSYQNTNKKTTYLLSSFLRYYLKSNAPALAKFEWKLQRKGNLTYIMNCNNMARTGIGHEEDDEMMITGMNMYPNPVLSGSQLNLSIPSEGQTEATIMVTNMIGQTVMSQVVAIDEDANEVVLPVENVKPGYYFVTILNGDGKLTRPLVIQ